MSVSAVSTARINFEMCCIKEHANTGMDMTLKVSLLFAISIDTKDPPSWEIAFSGKNTFLASPGPHGTLNGFLGYWQHVIGFVGPVSVFIFYFFN